ncbi:hypothetical protein HYS97_02415 [Candidatus Daviesbacteria bacterium]|nr:hypothetical protein [Candidatus Daviesbacteria bacterium]
MHQTGLVDFNFQIHYFEDMVQASAPHPEIIVNEGNSSSGISFRVIFLILGLLIIIVGISLGVYLTQKQTNLTPKASEIKPTIQPIQKTTNAPPKSTAITKGDGNSDGKVDEKDLLLIKSLRSKPAGNYPQLDFNGDGVINSFDIASLNKALSGK